MVEAHQDAPKYTLRHIKAYKRGTQQDKRRHIETQNEVHSKEKLGALKHKSVPTLYKLLFLSHCYIKCPFLDLGASFGQFSSNGISFHHELIFAMGLEF